MKLQVLSWSPSRLAKWRECPAKVKYEDLMKLCPVCFRGRVSGGFDGVPVTCDTCDKPQPEREALERGNRLDAALTEHLAPQDIVPTQAEVQDVNGVVGAPSKEEDLKESLRHPQIASLVKKLRKTKGVVAQLSLAVDASWRQVEWFAKSAWLRAKMDVVIPTKKLLKIIDWKSGNIDKSKGVIRERPEYHDAMRIYQAVGLSCYPQAEAEATMAFLDAPPKLESPFKSLPVLKRKDLGDMQVRINEQAKPMLADTNFAPRPGMHCRWCDFSKGRGGPCPF